jgi:hypothetical protein
VSIWHPARETKNTLQLDNFQWISIVQEPTGNVLGLPLGNPGERPDAGRAQGFCLGQMEALPREGTDAQSARGRRRVLSL